MSFGTHSKGSAQPGHDQMAPQMNQTSGPIRIAINQPNKVGLDTSKATNGLSKIEISTQGVSQMNGTSNSIRVPSLNNDGG